MPQSSFSCQHGYQYIYCGCTCIQPCMYTPYTLQCMVLTNATACKLIVTNLPTVRVEINKRWLFRNCCYGVKCGRYTVCKMVDIRQHYACPVYSWVRACLGCYTAQLWLWRTPQLRNGCYAAPGWRLAGLLYHAKLNLSHIHIYHKYIYVYLPPFPMWTHHGDGGSMQGICHRRQWLNMHKQKLGGVCTRFKRLEHYNLLSS